MYHVLGTKTRVMRIHSSIKKNYKMHNNVITKRNIYDNISKNISSLGNELKNKTDDFVSQSTDITLDKALKTFNMLEQKIINNDMNNVDIGVSFTLGPITLNINKKITLDE